MKRDQTGGPRLYRPAEVAKKLGCSEWWVKEQARRCRIPYTWIGGSYRFTEEHVAEIVLLFEVRPDDVTQEEPRRRSVPRPRAPEGGKAPVVQLRARAPRRTRNGPHPSPGAA